MKMSIIELYLLVPVQVVKTGLTPQIATTVVPVGRVWPVVERVVPVPVLDFVQVGAVKSAAE
jgi:hypothetical protein